MIIPLAMFSNNARELFVEQLHAGNQDVPAREAGNRQPYAGNVPVAPPAQALPYRPATEAVSAAPDNQQALQQQVEQLQAQLRALQQQKTTPTEHVG